jgi:hypothetical protein
VTATSETWYEAIEIGFGPWWHAVNAGEPRTLCGHPVPEGTERFAWNFEGTYVCKNCARILPRLTITESS